MKLFLLLIGLAFVLFQILPASSQSAGEQTISSNPPLDLSDSNGAVYYVSPSGSDSYPGTLNSPWRTIQYAVNRLNPGDTLLARGGVYAESVTVMRSGTAQDPITIRAYPNETPILDGDNYRLPSASLGVLLKIDAAYIHLSGFEIRNGNYMAVSLNRQHILVSDLNVHHHMETGVIIIGDNSIVENSTIWSNGLANINGNMSRGGWSSALTAARSPDGAVIRGNTVFNNWGEGISTFEANGTTIEDNIVYDNWGANIYISDATNVLVQRNLVYGSSNSQITTGIRVGIMMGDERYTPPSSHITIINNMLYGNRRNYYWWQGSSGGRLDHVLIANNTFANSRRSANFQIDGVVTHTNTRIENNIFLQEDSLDIGVAGSVTGLTFSHNLWSKAPPSNMRGSGDIIAGPMLWQSGSTHAGMLNGDWFRLNTSSPAINQGKYFSEVVDDYFKQARFTPFDMGAHEHVFIPTHFYYTPLILH